MAGTQATDTAGTHEPPRDPPGAPPDPPSLWHVFAVGLVVVVFVWFLPALWTILGDLLGSPWLALLGLTALGAAVGVLYLQLFR